MARIYLSSTFADLEEHRALVTKTLHQSGHEVTAMEDYVARDDRPLDACLADLDACDLYVGLYAWRYGYVPEDGNPERRSITELEYRHALANGIPCLVFLLDADAPWKPRFQDSHTGDGEAGRCIRKLRNELTKNRLASFFDSAENLARLVATAVNNRLREQAASPAAGASPGKYLRKLRMAVFPC